MSDTNTPDPVSAQDSNLLAMSEPLSPIAGLVRSLSDQSLSSVDTVFAEECLQEGVLPDIEIFADEDSNIFPSGEQMMAVDPSSEVLTDIRPAGGAVGPPGLRLLQSAEPDSTPVSTDSGPLSLVSAASPTTATTVPLGSTVTTVPATVQETLDTAPSLAVSKHSTFVIPKMTLRKLQGSLSSITGPLAPMDAANSSWADNVSAASASSRESSRDPSPLGEYPPASVRGPLRASRGSRIPIGSTRNPPKRPQVSETAPVSSAEDPENPTGDSVPASPQGRGSRRKTSPPEGSRSSKKHKRNEGPQFPLGVLDDRANNFGGVAPPGALGFQGRAFQHHFNTDRQGMRNEHTGRVAPYHAPYQSLPTLSEGQTTAIAAVCQLQDGVFLCHFCPDGIMDFAAYADSPLRPDNVYDSAAELYEHVCLYHYPFVHGYDCGYCQVTVAAFPTWSLLATHLQRCHDGLSIQGQAQSGPDLADRLDCPEGRAVHRRCRRPIYNDKFIPPRRLPRSFTLGHVSRSLHAYAWGPWMILLKSIQCVPDLVRYHTRFLTFSRGVRRFKWAFGSISDRPAHQSAASVALLSAAEVAQLPVNILAAASPLRASAMRAAGSYARTVVTGQSFAQVASQPVQVTPSRGPSEDTTPERGPSRSGVDLRDSLSRSVLTDSLQLAIASTVQGRLVTLADPSAMDHLPAPAPDSFRVVSPVPSVPDSPALGGAGATVKIPVGGAPYVPVRSLTLANVTQYQGTTARTLVAQHYYEAAAWVGHSTTISDLDRAEFVRIKQARSMLRTLEVPRPPLNGPAPNTVLGVGTRPKAKPLATPAVTPSVSNVSMRSVEPATPSAPSPWLTQYEAFKAASIESCPPAVPSIIRDVQYRLWSSIEDQDMTEVYGPHRDTPMAAHHLLSAAQLFRQTMTDVCRTVGDEDIFSFNPRASPGSFLRGMSQEISDTLGELSQASSLVNAQLATQTSLEAAQSLARSPDSTIFRRHADIFGCAPLSETADLRRRLEASEREVALLRAQPSQAAPPSVSSPVALVEACRSRLVKLPSAMAGECARVWLFACLDQEVEVPDWLLELSRSRK